MTKGIMDKYLCEIHKRIISTYPNVTLPALTKESIFTYYYSWISSVDDIFKSHMQMLQEIFK